MKDDKKKVMLSYDKKQAETYLNNKVSIESVPMNKDDIYEKYFSDNNKEMKCPLCEMGYASTPLSKKEPEEIVEDLTSMVKSIGMIGSSKPPSLLILGHPDMPRKELVKKILNAVNRNNIVNISFKEVDNLLENKEDLLCAKLPDINALNFKDEFLPILSLDQEIPLTDFFKEEKPSKKSRNFKERPSIPNKKRRWKK
jgi:hypothetical protein